MERPCEDRCPYLTSQRLNPEVARYAADNVAAGAASAGIGLLYMWRLIRTRNCTGPLPLSEEYQTVFCSTLQRGILPNGRPASDIVDKILSPQQAIEVRNPERWQELYEQAKQEKRDWHQTCIDSMNSGTYSDEELSFARNTSLEDSADLFGINVLDPEQVRQVVEDPAFAEKKAIYERFLEVHECVRGADEVIALQQQLGPQTTTAQAIEAVVVMQDKQLRMQASFSLQIELEGGQEL